MTRQMNIYLADPKANAFVFLFLSTAHFLKPILGSRTNGTLDFVRHTSRPFRNTKRSVFCQYTKQLSPIILAVRIRNIREVKKLTQEEVAYKCNVSASGYGQIERKTKSRHIIR